MAFIPPLSWQRWTPEQQEWMRRTYERLDPATAERFRDMVGATEEAKTQSQMSGFKERP